MKGMKGMGALKIANHRKILEIDTRLGTTMQD